MLAILIFSPFAALSASGGAIGVLPFQSEKKADGERLAARLLVKLHKTGRYTLVERGRLKKALEEIARGQSGLVREDQQIRVGKLLGARYLVLGETSKLVSFAGLYSASVRVIKTESGAVIAAAEARGRQGDLASMLFHKLDNILSIYILMQNPKSPYSVLLKLNKGRRPVYSLGEKISVRFRVKRLKRGAPARVYIRLYSINARGAMILIYPNRYSGDKPIEIDREYRFPDKKDDFEWELVKPTGRESIQAIVSREPISLFKERKVYLKKNFPTVRARGGHSVITYRGIVTRLKKSRIKDWSAERVTYELRE